MHISVTDAKAKLTDLVRRAQAGDEVILTRHGHPAARIALGYGDSFAYALAKEHDCPCGSSSMISPGRMSRPRSGERIDSRVAAFPP